MYAYAKVSPPTSEPRTIASEPKNHRHWTPRSHVFGIIINLRCYFTRMLPGCFVHFRHSRARDARVSRCACHVGLPCEWGNIPDCTVPPVTARYKCMAAVRHDACARLDSSSSHT